MQPHRRGDDAEGEAGDTGDKGRGKGAGGKQREVESLQLVHDTPHRCRRARGATGDRATLGRPKWLRGGCREPVEACDGAVAEVNRTLRKGPCRRASDRLYAGHGVVADAPSDGRSSKLCATRTARSAIMD